MLRFFVRLIVVISIDSAREEENTQAVKLGYRLLGLTCLASFIAASLFTSITLANAKMLNLKM
ncbi:hypothetical protein M3Y98_01203200 [Aphelenchoides besseyi]|nr:hypothetical protein M3Y98_01203200 [Aphelenchoides besseyi]KAI6193094.1 hypothetical protein M3Y96_00981600 [Aphelenchoides besseyi]